MSLEEKLAEAESLIKKGSYETDYDVEHELGRGKFAIVKRCVHKKTGKVYAAKLVKKSRSNTHGRSGREQLLMEISVLSRSTHPKMVRLYDVFETRLEMQIILEYAEGGDLHRHCIETDVARTEKEICYLIRQILEATRYLHDEKIVHLDLKPDNILLAKKSEVFPEIRLIDFGLSRSLEGPYSQFDIVGTPEYVAPEVLAYDPIDYGSDMWSIGVVTYVLLSGISPFAGDDVMETYSYIGSVEYDFECEEFSEISDEAIDFIEKLLLRRPGDRMTAGEALEHEWIKQLDGGVSTEDVMEAQHAKKEILPEDLLKSPMIGEGARLSDAGYVSSNEGDMSSNSVDNSESSVVEEAKVELPESESEKLEKGTSSSVDEYNVISNETNGHSSSSCDLPASDPVPTLLTDVGKLASDDGTQSALTNSTSVEDMSCEGGDDKTDVCSDRGESVGSVIDPSTHSNVQVITGSHVAVKKETNPLGTRYGTRKNDITNIMNKFSCKEEKSRSPPTSRHEGFRSSIKPLDKKFLVENSRSENRSSAVGVNGNNFQSSTTRKFSNGVEGRREKESVLHTESGSKSNGTALEKRSNSTDESKLKTDESKRTTEVRPLSAQNGMVSDKNVEAKVVPRKFPIPTSSKKPADEPSKSPPPETKPKPSAPSKLVLKDENSAGPLQHPKSHSPRSPHSVTNKHDKDSSSNELSSNSLFKMKQSQTKDDGVRVGMLSEAREISGTKSPPPPVATKPKSPISGASCSPSHRPTSPNAVNEVYLSCKMPTSKSDNSISLRTKATNGSVQASTPPTKRHVSTASNEVAIKLGSLGSKFGSSQINHCISLASSEPEDVGSTSTPPSSEAHLTGKGEDTDLVSKYCDSSPIQQNQVEQDNTKTELRLKLNIGGGNKKVSIGPLVSKSEQEGQKVVKQVKISAIDDQDDTGFKYSRNRSYDSVSGSEGEQMTLRQRYSVAGAGRNEETNGAVTRRHSTNSSRNSGSVSSGSGKTYRRLYVTKVRNSKIYEHDFDIVATEAAKIAQRIDKDVLQADKKLKSTDLKLLPNT